MDTAVISRARQTGSFSKIGWVHFSESPGQCNVYRASSQRGVNYGEEGASAGVWREGGSGGGKSGDGQLVAGLAFSLLSQQFSSDSPNLLISPSEISSTVKRMVWRV